MAGVDNVIVTPGSGQTIAADGVLDGTLGNVSVQYVKVMDGTINSTNKQIINSSGQTLITGPIYGADGATPASLTNSFPVQVTSGNFTGNITSSGVAFGPTADGSPAANPPILIGGTADGTGNGTVGVLKVTSAGIGSVSIDQIAGTGVTAGAGLPVNIISGNATLTGNATVQGLGTAGTATGGVMTVQGQANMTALSVTLSGNVTSVTQTPATTGGVTPYSGSLGNTTTAVKTSAGQVFSIAFFNSNASAAYVQFFNLPVANVTLGSTTPVESIGLPPGGGIALSEPNGVAYSSAITIACTTTRTGSTGPSATVDLNIRYK